MQGYGGIHPGDEVIEGGGNGNQKPIFVSEQNLDTVGELGLGVRQGGDDKFALLDGDTDQNIQAADEYHQHGAADSVGQSGGIAREKGGHAPHKRRDGQGGEEGHQIGGNQAVAVDEHPLRALVGQPGHHALIGNAHQCDHHVFQDVKDPHPDNFPGHAESLGNCKEQNNGEADEHASKHQIWPARTEAGVGAVHDGPHHGVVDGIKNTCK